MSVVLTDAGGRGSTCILGLRVPCQGWKDRRAWRGAILVPYPPRANVRLEAASNVLATTSFTPVEVGAGR